ncbi:unnamed protein product [Ambrosiozyma monospora]|uniref:Unnamed protein product n=1 Tax=Ambrosiozyma monospora TaxID=43982 RepID=A0ACB5UDG6_AMBMO|nr:unnamed protein product [Ambrosiozyma monospora]
MELRISLSVECNFKAMYELLKDWKPSHLFGSDGQAIQPSLKLAVSHVYGGAEQDSCQRLNMLIDVVFKLKKTLHISLSIASPPIDSPTISSLYNKLISECDYNNEIKINTEYHTELNSAG